MSNRNKKSNQENRSKKKKGSTISGEASFSNLDDQPSQVIDLQEFKFLDDGLKCELDPCSVALLSKTKLDPERFLKPSPVPKVNLMERVVNPHKVLDLLSSFMEVYYDIKADPDPYSDYRQRMDQHIWDSLAYVTPILCKQVIAEVLKAEQLILTLQPNAVIFGDIHGNLNDIYYIYKNYINNKTFDSFKFIFLGDYVDRGPKGLEVVVFLLTSKLIDPKRFIMLRGNHEVAKVNKKYGFKTMIDQVYKDTYIKDKRQLPKLIYDSINITFNNLPVGAVIRFKNKPGVFCAHGGIPSENLHPEKNPWKIKDINNFSDTFKPHSMVPKKNMSNEQRVIHEILWNDPISDKVMSKMREKKLFYVNKKRGGHCSLFSEEAAIRFLERNYLRLVIRGHQYTRTRQTGFAFNFRSKQIVTVFSSSNYCGAEENVTGCVLVSQDRIRPQALRHYEESKLYKQFNQFEITTDDNKQVISVAY